MTIFFKKKFHLYIIHFITKKYLPHTAPLTTYSQSLKTDKAKPG